VRNKLRPQLAILNHSESEHGNLLGGEVCRQLKAIGKQRLHHQAHLVLGRIACRRASILYLSVMTHFGRCANISRLCGVGQILYANSM
jgi:hypothetical protein